MSDLIVYINSVHASIIDDVSRGTRLILKDSTKKICLDRRQVGGIVDSVRKFIEDYSDGITILQIIFNQEEQLTRSSHKTYISDT
jgi:hypothetical protein